MSLYIASLNSGSNGNSYYIGNDREAVLIDAGLSCRETERRMRRLGLQMTLVKAIFISHEHDDHIRGLEVLSKRYQIPVYITDETLGNSRLELDAHLIQPFSPSGQITIGGLTVLAFSKTHDAIDPHSFVVSTQREDGSPIRIGVFTDIGHVCDNLTVHFQSCHAAFLESNYDEHLLENGRYPWPLKNRIRGGKGHLSNHQALELFVRHRPAFMSHLLLAHLSQDNNRPDLVQRLFEDASKGTFVVVASRHGESEVYAIDGKYDGQPGIGAEAEWADNPGRKEPPAPTTTTEPAAKTAGIGHSRIRRRKTLLQNPPIQTSLF
jgi:phosphoribosyl 1,2-cyclic phosphodiesterase